jgi:hypothetical protein
MDFRFVRAGDLFTAHGPTGSIFGMCCNKVWDKDDAFFYYFVGRPNSEIPVDTSTEVTGGRSCALRLPFKAKVDESVYWFLGHLTFCCGFVA